MKSTVASTFNAHPDIIIWDAYREGDRQAFAVLYHRYFKILYRAGLRISADTDLVKDAVQDLFIELWKQRANLSMPQSVKAYLISSIQRKIIRHVKTIITRQTVINQIPGLEFAHSNEDDLISEQLHQEQQTTVKRAMSILTKRQKEAVYLKFYANLSYTEIAKLMAISTDSIYNLISKSIDNLQQELTKASEQKVY